MGGCGNCCKLEISNENDSLSVVYLPWAGIQYYAISAQLYFDYNDSLWMQDQKLRAAKLRSTWIQIEDVHPSSNVYINSVTSQSERNRSANIP